ncbi:TOBE domain-containing protein [Devosia sp. LjRoot3]|uniref:TOBE domain-containing protein n=1 Tax=Devosia sp. LjRoot3 TaxID=3342319 RepID=UPI003ECD3BDF
MARSVEVITVEPKGAETHIVARLSGVEIVVTLHERVACEPGDRIRLSVEPGYIHLFDASTFARIPHPNIDQTEPYGRALAVRPV